jgi:hypothetical protein
MGLVIFGGVGLYILFSIGVVLLAAAYAGKNGASVKLWGWSVAFIMYSIPFWDWLPTIAVHQYYCATESGFWVYQTLDQWEQENPGVMETLTTQRIWPNKHDGDMENYVSTSMINQRINYINKKNGPFLFNRWRHEQVIQDSKTGQELARQIDFSTGNGNIGGELEIRFWLHRDNCGGGQGNAINFVKFVNKFKGVEK